MFLFFYSVSLTAQEGSGYEETTVSLKIPKIGVVDATAYIQGESLFLPIIDIFTFLKIQNTPTAGYDSVSGFFINEESKYLIDRSMNKIYYQGKVFELKEGDVVRTETNLFLRSDFFGKVFGMQIDFDFRAMTATLSTNFELPVIREMRLELMRRDLNRLKGEIKADTTIGRKYPLFHFGMADWSVIATQQFGGKSNVWLNLALGSILAGGEANVLLSYSNQQAFTEKHQYYLWHYANNDRKLLKQVMLGKIGAVSTSSIFGPLVGVQFTNTPTTFRRSFGTYTLTDYTSPGWVVELYVNNVLVDYVKSDASGFFTFNVPLVYGTSTITLRFYGPWGEERLREKSITIPFNFLPPRQLEYTVTAGMVEDARNNIFSRASVGYGLNQRMTIGGGVEYLSSVKPGSAMPFVNLSMRVGSNMLISGEYTYGVRFKGVLSYHLPWDIQLEANYIRYHANQTAVSTNFLEERKVSVSVPVRGKRFSSLVRLTVDQVLLNNSKNLTAEMLISATAFGVSANLTTYGLFYDPVHPYIYSTLSLGFRIPGRFIVIPQAQFEYSHKRFISMKIEVERQMFKNGVLRMSYEHNFAVNIQNIQIGLRYDFPFAQTGLTATYGNNAVSMVQSARGSVMFDGKNRWVGANNMTNVGKGGLVLIPFLDLNVNGKRDVDEPRVTGLNVHLTGGRTELNKRDSSVRVFDLEPFTSCLIEIDKTSFENVAWQIKKPLISVAIDPNQFKLVEIPVAVFGEGSGMIYVRKNGELIGQGRIVVAFYHSDSTLAGRVMSESDGYYSFLGLAPGNYFVKVDTARMPGLHMSVTPASFPITILRNSEGDLAGGLDFVLNFNHADSVSSIVSQEENKISMIMGPITPDEPVGKHVKTSKQLIIPDEKVSVNADLNKTAEPVKKTVENEDITGNCSFSVQAGAFRIQSNADKARLRVHAFLNMPVVIVSEDGYYKVRVIGMSKLADSRQIILRLSEKGFPGAFIPKK